MNTPLATGPMATTLRDCDLFVRSVLSLSPFLEDPQLKKVEWKTPKKASSKIRIGMMLDDGLIQPQPPVVRALKWVAEELAKQPHQFELVPFKYPDAKKAMSLLRTEGGYWPDAGNWVRKATTATGEPLFPLTQSILRDAASTPLTVTENLLYQEKLHEFQYAMAKSWTKQNVDFVLAPCFVGPASMHDTAHYWNYTCLWNLVDHPSIVFPTPIQSQTGEKYLEADSRPLSPECEAVRQLWKSGDFEGAPINLQLIARPNHDIELWDAIHSLNEVLPAK